MSNRNERFNVVRIHDNVVDMRNASRYKIIKTYCLPKGRFNQFLNSEFEFQGKNYRIEANKTPAYLLHGNHKTTDEEKYNHAILQLKLHGNTSLSMRSEHIIEMIKKEMNVKVTKYFDDKVSDRMICSSLRGKYHDYHYIIEVVK